MLCLLRSLGQQKQSLLLSQKKNLDREAGVLMVDGKEWERRSE